MASFSAAIFCSSSVFLFLFSFFFVSSVHSLHLRFAFSSIAFLIVFLFTSFASSGTFFLFCVLFLSQLVFSDYSMGFASCSFFSSSSFVVLVFFFFFAEDTGLGSSADSSLFPFCFLSFFLSFLMLFHFLLLLIFLLLLCAHSLHSSFSFFFLLILLRFFLCLLFFSFFSSD